MSIKQHSAILLFLCLGSVLHAQETSVYEKKSLIKRNDTLPYRIMYPENFNKAASYPLVLFLHGAGERGNDNEKQLVHGSALFADGENRANYPAIVVFPQCSRDSYWSNADVDRSPQGVKLVFKEGGEPTKPMELVIKLMDSLLSEPYVKRDQVYVAGLSMGGMGTFEILSRRPDMFAAAIPICGGGSPKSAPKYAKKVPIWVIHGAKDDVVAPDFSIQMVSALLKAGAYPRFTLYNDANHNSWDPAFAEPDFLEWLFSHKK